MQQNLFEGPQDCFWVTTRLVRESTQPYRIQSPEDIRDMAINYLDLENCDREHFIAVCLDRKGKSNAACTISIGSISETLVHPREVFKPAILASAASIVLIHNHPSGDPSPSPDDIKLTKRLVEVGEILGIEVLDHIIIGVNNYVSLKAMGAM